MGFFKHFLIFNSKGVGYVSVNISLRWNSSSSSLSCCISLPSKTHIMLLQYHSKEYSAAPGHLWILNYAPYREDEMSEIPAASVYLQEPEGVLLPYRSKEYSAAHLWILNYAPYREDEMSEIPIDSHKVITNCRNHFRIWTYFSKKNLLCLFCGKWLIKVLFRRVRMSPFCDPLYRVIEVFTSWRNHIKFDFWILVYWIVQISPSYFTFLKKGK